MRVEDEKLLNFACERGILDLSGIRSVYEMDKRKEILKKHASKIWQGKNGRWYTYLLTEGGERKQVTRKTREALEDVIVAGAVERKDNPTLNSVFERWIKKKVDYGNIIPATETRYRNDWKSYFKEFGKRRIRRITEMDIEIFVLQTVHDREMTRKGFNGLRTLLYGVFRHARKEGYVKYEIKQVIADIDFSKNSFRKVKKEDIEQVFFVDEERDVINYLTEHKDMVNLGLLLLFKSGLRVGELVALKPRDIAGNRVHVDKTETFYINEKGKQIREVKFEPKTEAGNRDVIIPDSCLWILEELRSLNPFGEWLFWNFKQNKRYTTDAFRKRLYDVCDAVGAVRKSPHKIRKTYGSILYDSDAPESLLCKQMGHTDVTTLQKHYYYNRRTDEQNTEILNKIVGL